MKLLKNMPRNHAGGGTNPQLFTDFRWKEEQCSSFFYRRVVSARLSKTRDRFD